MPLPYQNPGDPQEVKGTKQPVEQPDSYRFIRGQGWTTVKSWHGLTKDGIFGMAKQLELAGYTNISVQKSNGIWQVEATIEGEGEGVPPDDGAGETWEIDSLSESVDIINHPMFQSLSDNSIRVVIDAVQNPIPGTAPTLDGAALTGDAKTLYELLLRKVESYNYEVPVLRHTLTPAPASVNIDGRLEIWTPAQIGVTTSAIAGMVSQFYNNNPFGTTAKHTWGWLNTVLRVNEDTSGRSQLIEEWLLGNWVTEIYPNY